MNRIPGVHAVLAAIVGIGIAMTVAAETTSAQAPIVVSAASGLSVVWLHIPPSTSDAPLIAARTVADMPHLRLTASFPASDTTLTDSPTAVKLWFSEPADAATARITVKSAAGKAVPMGKVTRGAGKNDPVVSAFTEKLAAGRYTVSWRAMSKDGHVVNGEFAFRVSAGKL